MRLRMDGNCVMLMDRVRGSECGSSREIGLIAGRWSRWMEVVVSRRKAMEDMGQLVIV